MTMLSVDNFSGIAPRVDKRRLAEDLAQIAENCLFDNSTLGPLRDPVETGFVLNGTTKSLYYYQSTWLQFTENVSVAPALIPNDTYDRIYISDSTYPKVRSGGASYRLGIPQPSLPLTAAATQEPDENDPDTLVDAETCYYVFTYVDAFGSEGPPSLPSNVVNKVRDTQVDLTFPATPSGNYNFGAGAAIRVYRSNTGTESTGFQFVLQVPFATATTADTVKNDELQEELPSATWFGPPDDDSATWPDGPLQGITTGDNNGIMAGFAEKTVYLSEPYLPHAWPIEYAVTGRHKILGIVWIDAGLLVVTEGEPWMLVGAHPASMSIVNLNAGYPCIAAESLVNMGGYAMYVTWEGLVMVEGTQITLVTEDLVTKRQWLASPGNFYPIHVKAGRWEGRYVAFYDNGAGATGSWIFDPRGGKNALTTSTLTSAVAYTRSEDGELWCGYNGFISLFGWGDPLPYTWKSKDFYVGHDTSFAYMEYLGDGNPTATVWRGGVQIYNGVLTDAITTLPGGDVSESWEFQIEHNDDITLFALYEDLAEAA